MKGFVIRDENGYFVIRRRYNGKVFNMWSTRKRDAARFHFYEAAKKIAATIPQRVTIE